MEKGSKIKKITSEIEKVIIGKSEVIDMILMAILADGHILIEDIPGVGKTTLALSFAKVLGLNQSRVQFTPDILPSDIIGFSMYEKDLNKFIYQPGAIMCNLFLADEINRTSPKTQSALLEVMEEGSVTVDGNTYLVPDPFVVIATENPIGYAGTQMLPESQLDRFLICVKMGYPSKNDEIKILLDYAVESPLQSINQIITKNELIQMKNEVKNVYIHQEVLNYIVDLVTYSRDHDLLSLGLSTRGTLAIASMAKARAYMSNRNYVIPNDVVDVFQSVARHRIQLNSQAKMRHLDADEITNEILSTVKKPRPEK